MSEERFNDVLLLASKKITNEKFPVFSLSVLSKNFPVFSECWSPWKQLTISPTRKIDVFMRLSIW